MPTNLWTQNNQFTGATRGGRLTGGSYQRPTTTAAPSAADAYAGTPSTQPATRSNPALPRPNTGTPPASPAAAPVQTAPRYGYVPPQVNQPNLDYINATMGLTNTQYNAYQGYLGDQRGFTNRGFDLNNQGANLDWQGKNLNLDKERFQNNQTLQNFGRDKGFLDRLLGLQGQLTDQQRRALSIDEADIATQLNRSRRQLDNTYTSRGAWFAPERGLSRQDMDVSAFRDVGRVGIRREGTFTQDAMNQLGYDQSLAGLTDKQAQAQANQQFIQRNQGLIDQALQHALAGNALQRDEALHAIDWKSLGAAGENMKANLDAYFQYIANGGNPNLGGQG